MATAIVSLVRGQPVADDVAMTGEITLTGQVLPIGGLKEKALAAQRSGIGTVIAPKLNEGDVDDIPEHLRRRIDFVFVEEIGEVLEKALERPRTNGRRTATRAKPRRVYAHPAPASEPR
jgi:ATP-dependent Lon protease